MRNLLNINIRYGSDVPVPMTLLVPFESKLMNNSDCVIDFAEELTDTGKEFYQEQLEFLHISRTYAKN